MFTLLVALASLAPFLPHPPDPVPPPPTLHPQPPAYLAYTKAAVKFGLNKGKAKKAKKVEGPVTIDEDDWIKGTHYEVQKRRRAAAAKKA